MWHNCDQWLLDHKDNMIQSLQELVRVQSVLLPSEKEEEPFGPAIAQSLYKVTALANSLGLKARIVDGYAAIADIGEQGKLWGALSHADVVPAGKGWSVPPFEAQIIDGKIYGRGTSDDKGPLVATLYAMAAIKACGLPLKNRFRHIIGGDEETDFRCIEHYLKTEETPVGGFSPDAAFPLIIAEKGILHFTLSAKWDESEGNDLILMRLSGGERVNMVPSSAEAVFWASEAGRTQLEEAYFRFPDHSNLSWEEDGGEITIRAKGQNAHACNPHFGVNAIYQLFSFLGTVSFKPAKAQQSIVNVVKLAEGIFNGKGFGIKCADAESGELTITPDLLSGDSHGMEIAYDMRWPVTVPLPELWDRIIQKAANYNFTVEQEGGKQPLYLAKDSYLVSSLLKVYGDFMGMKEPQPISTGGGTYCRAIPGFAAFGPVFEGEEELAHQSDEFISIDNMMKLAQIYTRAIYALIGE